MITRTYLKSFALYSKTFSLNVAITSIASTDGYFTSICSWHIFFHDMAENKQQRMLNWTRQEIWALLEGVEKYANYVAGKRFGPGVTAQTRQENWLAIADMVNATGGQNRAVAKVEKSGQI